MTLLREPEIRGGACESIGPVAIRFSLPDDTIVMMRRCIDPHSTVAADSDAQLSPATSSGDETVHMHY